MSFYGNIANVSKTQMKIDKIYANRCEMDAQAQTDGIFIGRYVLIEYDNDQFYKSHFYKKDNKLFLSYPVKGNGSPVPAIIGVDVLADEIVRIIATYEDVNGESIYHNFDEIAADTGDTFWIVSGEAGAQATVTKKIIDSNNFINNYNKDKEKYGEKRGYDSTVWMKMGGEGAQYYVHIADLNSIVPTFDLAIDAPPKIEEEGIQVPYFDGNNTNVYYKMHSPATWGFKLEEEPYFNEKGFDVSEQSLDKDTVDEIFLTLEQSGRLYSSGKAEDDIQVLNINLPSLGNTISQIWDLVYGDKRKLTIEYDGVQLKEDTETKTYDLTTLSGCINSAQEIIGKIVEKTLPEEDLTEEEYNKNLIYRDLTTNLYYTIYYNSTKDKYEYINSSLDDHQISNLFSAIAQINRILGPDSEDNVDATTLRGALNTVEARMEEWKIELAEEALQAFGYISDKDGTILAEATYSIVTDENGRDVKLPDTLRIDTDKYMNITSITDENYSGRGVSLSLNVDEAISENSENLITSGAVHVEVNNINQMIGNISDILTYIQTGILPE